MLPVLAAATLHDDLCHFARPPVIEVKVLTLCARQCSSQMLDRQDDPGVD